MDGISELLNSPNIELKVVEGKGRCLFAGIPFKKGDTIFEEDPLVSCQFAWNKTYQYLACDHCMKPLESVEENITRLTGNKCLELTYLEHDTTKKDDHRACNNCGEKYCSESCLVSAWKQYHRFLCHNETEDEPLCLLVERWKKMHYPPETMNIMLIARIIATIQMANDKEAVYNTFMQFCHLSINDDEALAYRLLGHKFERDIDEIWHMFCEAIQPKCNQERNGFINTLLSREGFIKILSLIGRNGQGIGSSILAEWSNKILNADFPSPEKEKIEDLVDTVYNEVEQHVGSFLNNEGSGLYIVQSCINHSCGANAKITYPFNSNKLALVAKRDIAPGEEILINYLDKCARKRSCHSRRKILKDHYLFTCMCTKCITDSANEPDVTSEEEEESDEDFEMT